MDPARDHISGPPDAPLTLLEYGDFQCPYCAAARPEVKQVQRELGSELRFVFRHFPMTTIHEFAMQAAEIAEAAGAQGKFWEMHDFLYENQDTLEDPSVALGFAAGLGLDVQRTTAEVAQHTHLERIREDFSGGIHSGVNGTPTFFVNGLRYDGPAIARYIVEAVLSVQMPGIGDS